MANLFNDNFNRANSTNLGASWTERADDHEIISNRVNVVTSSSGHAVVHTASFGTADYTVQSVMNWSVVTAWWFGLIGRRINYSTDDSNGYIAMIRSSDGLRALVYRQSGSRTNIAINSGTITTGIDYTVKLYMLGTSIKLYVNDIEEISSTNSVFSAAGDAGFYSEGDVGVLRYDDFTVDDFAAGGETITLDKWFRELSKPTPHRIGVINY